MLSCVVRSGDENQSCGMSCWEDKHHKTGSGSNWPQSLLTVEPLGALESSTPNRDLRARVRLSPRVGFFMASRSSARSQCPKRSAAVIRASPPVPTEWFTGRPRSDKKMQESCRMNIKSRCGTTRHTALMSHLANQGPLRQVSLLPVCFLSLSASSTVVHFLEVPAGGTVLICDTHVLTPSPPPPPCCLCSAPGLPCRGTCSTATAT